MGSGSRHLCRSNRQSIIPSAAPEATAKFVPSGKPRASGKWLPGSVSMAVMAVAVMAWSPALQAGLCRRPSRTSPWRRRITSAISPVQPVWWNAPMAAPLSPWKYSLKIRLSCQAGSVCSSSVPPKQARRPSRTAREDRDQPVKQVCGDLVQGQLPARSGRVFDGEVVAEEPVVSLKRLDDQVVQRKPDRASPVGVAAEHGRGGFGRLVVDARLDAFDVDHVGVVAVVGGQGPQAVRGQELGLVEQLGQQPLQPVRAGTGEQQPLIAWLPRSAPLCGACPDRRDPRGPGSPRTACPRSARCRRSSPRRPRRQAPG